MKENHKYNFNINNSVPGYQHTQKWKHELGNSSSNPQTEHLDTIYPSSTLSVALLWLESKWVISSIGCHDVRNADLETGNISEEIQAKTVQTFFLYQHVLVGGFNPFATYYSQIGSFPQMGLNTKNIWNHHLVLSFTNSFHQTTGKNDGALHPRNLT